MRAKEFIIESVDFEQMKPQNIVAVAQQAFAKLYPGVKLYGKSVVEGVGLTTHKGSEGSASAFAGSDTKRGAFYLTVNAYAEGSSMIVVIEDATAGEYKGAATAIIQTLFEAGERLYKTEQRELVVNDNANADAWSAIASRVGAELMESKVTKNITLQEYRRDVTLERLGSKLLAKLKKDPTNPFSNATGTPMNEGEIGEILRRFERADPTPNKQYVTWMITKYVNDPNFKFEDVLGQVADYLDKFHQLNLRRQLPSPRNDINRYANFGDFMSVMDEYDYPSAPSAAELTDKGTAVELYNDANIRVIIPEDQTAACYYGQGTRWCTAATRGENYFNQYSGDSPLIIVIPKKPAYKGEKYQLWFWYGVDGAPITDDDDFLEYWHNYGEEFMIDNEEYGQFMNEKDNEVSLKSLMKRFGASLTKAISVFEEKYPNHKYAVEKNFEAQR